MALRKMALALPCVLMLSFSLGLRAEDEPAPQAEEQQKSAFDVLYEVLDDSLRDKLDLFRADLENVIEETQAMCNQLEQKHSEIIATLKRELDLDMVPLSFSVVLDEPEEAKE